MGFTWDANEISVLTDPNFIDRLGHFVHSHDSKNYKFSMNVMGYQAMYYTQEFEKIVKSESSINSLQTEVKQVCRGMFSKIDDNGWEVSFRAEALVRNELDHSTHLPIGEVDYATDLVYSNTILFSLHETGNKIFTDWAQYTGLIENTKIISEIVTHQTKEFTTALEA